MRILGGFVVLVCFFLATPAWPSGFGADDERPAKGVFFSLLPPPRKVADCPPGKNCAPEAPSPTASWFTIGTFGGLGYALEANPLYKVDANGIVVEDQPSSVSRRLQFGAFALPSVVLGHIAERPLSFMIPLGAAGKDFSAGVGLSYGIYSTGSANVGFALATVLLPGQQLSREQRISLNNATPLGPNDDRNIGSGSKPVLIVGVYITPKLVTVHGGRKLPVFRHLQNRCSLFGQPLVHHLVPACLPHHYGWAVGCPNP